MLAARPRFIKPGNDPLYPSKNKDGGPEILINPNTDSALTTDSDAKTNFVYNRYHHLPLDTKIVAAGTSDIQQKTKCTNEEVLIKIWTILADLLEADGKSVKAPSRDNIQYALTLIKKSILDENNVPNMHLSEKLFLREAELAKYKGVYLYDNRPLQTLLELYPRDNSNALFKYELSATEKPNCREAFKELFRTMHLNYNTLANSPACSEEPTVSYNIYNSGFANQAAQLNTNINYQHPARSNDIMNFGPAWNEYNNVGGLVQNFIPPVESQKGFVPGQIPAFNPNEENILHAVTLSKDTRNIMSHDFTEDIWHAKNVADRMNSLYQSYNIPGQPTTPSPFSLPKNTLREKGSNFGTFNLGMQNSAPNMPVYSWPVMQTGFNNIPKQVNPNNNSVNAYTLNTNTVQTQPPVAEPTNVNQENAYPFGSFVNSKYHPHLAHDNEAQVSSNSIVPSSDILPKINSVPSNVNFAYNIHPYSYQTVEKQTEAPPKQKLEQILHRIPLTNNLQPVPYMKPNNYFNYNVQPNPKPEYSNIFQNNANSLNNNPNSLKFNYNTISSQYNSQAPPFPTTYTKYGYNQYAFRQPAVNQQKNNLFTYKLKQSIPDTVISQKLITSISPRFPPNYKVNMHSEPLHSYAYSGVSVQKNSPMFTPTSNYNSVFYNTYNGQAVIDKLADWASASATNAAKLNSDSDDAEIELTYLIKKQPNHRSAFSVQFRMPYKTFAKRLSNFMMTPSLRSGSPDTDLYEDLAAGHNVTIIQTETPIAEEHVNSSEDKILVKATYIEPNGKDKAVDINLVKEPEGVQESIVNPVNLPENFPLPILRN